MDLTTYIIIVILLFVVGTGLTYIIKSMAGPRKIEEIRKLMSARRFKEARSELQKILDKDDRSMIARYLLARCHMLSGDMAAASIEFRQCIKIGKYNPDVPETKVRENLATTYLALENYTEAKNEYLILTTIDPDNFENYYQLGKLFLNSGVYQRAIKFLGTAVKLNQRHTDALALIGQAYYQVQNYNEGRNFLTRALQLAPGNRQASYYLGLCLRFTGDLEWALKELEKAEKDEEFRDRAILAKGMVMVDQQSYAKAITELDRGIKVATSADVKINMRYLMAAAAEKSRDLHTAIEQWETIEQVRPGFRDVKEKLKQYQEFRTDDSIKDFMIASTAQFEGICRKIIENMELQILELEVLNENAIVALASEGEASRRTMRRFHHLIYIQREIEMVSEKKIRDFHEMIKTKNATRGIFMTTGDVSPAALSFASNRPIEIYDATSITDYVKKAVY